MSDEELKVLKAKRGQIKGKITRFKSYFDSIDKTTVDLRLITEVEMRLAKVSPLYDEFNDIQGQIELLDNSSDDETLNFESSYFGLVSSMQSFCDKFKIKNTDSASGSVSTHSGGSPQGIGGQSLVKLPPIKLNTFNGQYDSWLEFKDCFLALVHNNSALTDIQRFYYLRSSLEINAQQIIKSIEVSSANYTIAWKMLEERFENKKLIIHNHLKAIFDHCSITHESHSELRNLFDNVTKHLRSLNSLGLATDTWDSIIIYIMCSKFDPITRRDWECFKCEQDLPSMKDMNAFLKEKCEMLEKLEISSCSTNSKAKVRNVSSRSFASFEGNSKVKCYLCQNAHPIYRCESFLKLNINDRISSVKRLKLCLNCLRDSHPTWKCKLQKCIKCHKLHNSLLHLSSSNNSDINNSTSTVGANILSQTNQNGSHDNNVLSAQETSGADQSTTFHATNKCSDVASCCEVSEVLLSTALVRVVNGNKSVLCRALLDSGSQSNFISEKISKTLGLECKKVNHVVKGVGDALEKINNEVRITVNSCQGNFSIKTNCLVIPRITEKLPIRSINKNTLKIPSDISLADPEFNLPGDIDLLLGSGIFWTVLIPERKKMNPNMPVLQNTEFGWVIAGNLYLNSLACENRSFTFLNVNTNFESVNKEITKFWEVEELGSVNKIISREEKYCEDYFKDTVKKDISGKYIVKIPFKESVNELGDSKTMALHRFDLLEKRLNKNQELRKQYTDFMQEYKDLGHMVEVDAKNEDGYFLPHHAVVKQSSLTTKCRVVFDGSAKSSSGLSINDVQYTGPSLQQDIFLILIRFRLHKYVLSSDISKMYRQVLIDKDERKFQKIFWRADPEEQMRCYELNTVTYGTASAPYLAVRTLLQVAEDNENQYPLVAKIIKHDFYIDDLLTSSDSAHEIIKIQQDISKLLAKSGFELRKWLCNDPNIVKEFKLNNELDVAILPIGEQNKTLGIYWDAKNDYIKYNINIDYTIQPCQWNKRSILSIICQIYDPLGLLGPIVINAKLIMQDLWKNKFDWDQRLPQNFNENWLMFYNTLNQLNDLMIPRHASISKYVKMELHGFSDASTRAYGCCIYIRCLTPSGSYTCNLLCAKSRVAPIKLLSLPRLELCGAVLLANLIKKVITCFDVQSNDIYCWTDSTICLCWIRKEPSTWKQFVANRVQEIQNLTSINSWNHVRSEQNPADLVSRGVSASSLIKNDLWWFGPKWLLQDNSDWYAPEVEQLENVPETKTVVCAVVTNTNLIHDLLNRFSSLNKFLGVLSYLLHFIHNCRNNISKRKFGVLQPSELEAALSLTIRSVQKECFPQEYRNLVNKKDIPSKSKILSLNPFIHDELLRVGGRLRNSNVPFNSKHQIVLPNNHILTRLILRNEHERLLHCGAQQLMFSIRQKYWPISARSCCKDIVSKCLRCYKCTPKPINYLMGDLPKVRVNGFSIFENVGTDYGGPFLIKDRKTRGAKLTKAYICLFICMCTKAVHIELVSELTTDAFLACFKRFINRRGRPCNIYSDNGSNYLGANHEINAIYKFLENNSETISKSLLMERIKWHFIPANSPTFGGLWEAGIKSIKSHLKRMMGCSSLTFEEFSTLLIQVEGILNSRPLCAMSSDPDDNTVLTPAHFLIGRILTTLPEFDLSHVPENRLDKWQRIQSLIQQLWSRWQLEYLNELQMRQKWKANCQQMLKVGSMVLIKDDKAPPLQWPLGRITSIHKGADRIARVVTVQLRGGETKRAVNKICVLPIDC